MSFDIMSLHFVCFDDSDSSQILWGDRRPLPYTQHLTFETATFHHIAENQWQM